MSLQTTISLRGSTLIKSFPGGGTAPLRWGNTGMPDGLFRLFDGTAANQSNVAFLAGGAKFTIAASGHLDIDFTTGQVDAAGNAVVMTHLKWIYLQLTNNVTGDLIRLGPQGVTNAAQLWFEAATTNFYDDCRGMMFMGCNNDTGWALDGTHKIIRLLNPGANSLDGYFLAGGVQ